MSRSSLIYEERPCFFSVNISSSTSWGWSYLREAIATKILWKFSVIHYICVVHELTSQDLRFISFTSYFQSIIYLQWVHCFWLLKFSPSLCFHFKSHLRLLRWKLSLIFYLTLRLPHPLPKTSRITGSDHTCPEPFNTVSCVIRMLQVCKIQKTQLKSICTVKCYLTKFWVNRQFQNCLIQLLNNSGPGDFVSVNLLVFKIKAAVQTAAPRRSALRGEEGGRSVASLCLGFCLFVLIWEANIFQELFIRIGPCLFF